MFEVSFIIETEKMRSEIFQNGEVIAFDTQNQAELEEIVKSYCIADSTDSAIDKVIKLLAVRVECERINVRSLMEVDEVFNDWLMEACRSKIMAGEIISVIKRVKI